MRQNCGPTSPPRARGRRQVRRLLAVVSLGLALLASGPSVATAGGGKPNPHELWDSFPLKAKGKPRPEAANPPKTEPRVDRNALNPDSSSSGVLLYAWIAVAVATAAVLAAVILVPRLAELGLYGGGGSQQATRFWPRRKKGESIMGSERRKLWGRREHDSDGQSQMPRHEDQPARDEPQQESRLANISAYGLKPAPEKTEEEVSRGEPADATEVGAAVGNVLKSADEAAARMRRSAHAEAAKIRDEARSEVEAELAQARRVRAEAEADAESTRATASAFAQQLRLDAEGEAQELLQQARARLERADAEIAERLRRAEQAARHRRDALVAETERYHERLERMLGVFQGMSSQLEELLAQQEEEKRAEIPAEERLEEALQPARSGTDS
jgi:hypothetical protein